MLLPRHYQHDAKSDYAARHCYNERAVTPITRASRYDARRQNTVTDVTLTKPKAVATRHDTQPPRCPLAADTLLRRERRCYHGRHTEHYASVTRH